jgi:hypothetical protein
MFNLNTQIHSGTKHSPYHVTREYEVGENVTLVKTKIDRGSSDLPRLPCKICDVRGT